MGTVKTIRDPMYGYITIEEPFAQLIDTEEFQRLRNIRQTDRVSVSISERTSQSLCAFFGSFSFGEKGVKLF